MYQHASLITISPTPLPWLCKCYQMHPLPCSLLSIKAKLWSKGCLPASAVTMAGGNVGFIHRSKRSAVSGFGLFPGFAQPKCSRGTNLLVALWLVKPASPVQSSKHLTAPSELQPGSKAEWWWLCSACLGTALYSPGASASGWLVESSVLTSSTSVTCVVMSFRA